MYWKYGYCNFPPPYPSSMAVRLLDTLALESNVLDVRE